MISSAGCAWDLQCFNGSCMCFIDENVAWWFTDLQNFLVAMSCEIYLRRMLFMLLNHLQRTAEANNYTSLYDKYLLDKGQYLLTHEKAKMDSLSMKSKMLENANQTFRTIA
ncbi:hypothetical protein VNO77_45182 [Canavalia gladiata]|uniref:Uncharacterized protein n=1 Tax=Canavalia gladiata TaxID=3824 RepID=A0AAN9JVF2_CANGL